MKTTDIWLNIVLENETMCIPYIWSIEAYAYPVGDYINISNNGLINDSSNVNLGKYNNEYLNGCIHSWDIQLIILALETKWFCIKKCIFVWFAE